MRISVYDAGRFELTKSQFDRCRSQLPHNLEHFVSNWKHLGLYFGLQEYSSPNDDKLVHYRFGRERFALCCVCDAHKRERIDSRQLDCRRNALPTSRLLQPVCYLRFSCDHGLNSCKSLCEDMQVGSVVQETVFSEKVARFACLRVEFRCMLHGGSSIVRSSSVRIRPRLRPVLYRTPQRNRQIYSLRHSPYVVLFNTVDINYIQLHKSREDDPTAQCVCNCNDSKTRKRSGKKP